jgi:hypothetical protein
LGPRAFWFKGSVDVIYAHLIWVRFGFGGREEGGRGGRRNGKGQEGEEQKGGERGGERKKREVEGRRGKERRAY